MGQKSYPYAVKKEAKYIYKDILQACKIIFPVLEKQLKKSNQWGIRGVSLKYIERRAGFWFYTTGTGFDVEEEYSPTREKGMMIQFIGNPYLSMEFRRPDYYPLFPDRVKIFTPLATHLEDIIIRSLRKSPSAAMHLACLKYLSSVSKLFIK